MDNMAYLQQIAGVDNNAAQQIKKNNNGILKKIFNVWTIAGTLVFITILVVVAVVTSSMNKVDTKDQDLMIQSYWTSTYLSKTIDTYSKQVKNAEIRNITASFKTVLQEIINSETEIMKNNFGIKVAELNPKKSPITADAEKANNDLNDILEDARLNAQLDRTFLREMTMQVAYIRSYQSEIKARTKDTTSKEFANKTEENLGNIYNRYYNFNSKTL